MDISIYGDSWLDFYRKKSEMIKGARLYDLSTDPGVHFAIEKVIFNDPATIVLWEDGSKTVVKAQDGDTFDKEKGLAMALLKKLLGNNGNYYKEIKRWTEDEND